MVIEFRHKGNFNRTESFLNRLKGFSIDDILNSYGQQGVTALAEATPRLTGTTANSWTYSIEKRQGSISIVWSNTNVNKGINIAVILQYGHGTRNGGWVEGRDYINPALQPLFDKIANDAWEKVVERR